MELTREERICLAAAGENENGTIYPTERNRTPLHNLVRLGFLAWDGFTKYTITTTGRNLIL